MSLAFRLHGVSTGCVRCGERARWIVLNMPLCDACKDGHEPPALTEERPS